QVVECTLPAFCLSIYQEGNDENVYSALCANNTSYRTSCQTLRVGIPHHEELSTDTCCCKTDLCNLAPNVVSYVRSCALGYCKKLKEKEGGGTACKCVSCARGG
ncbi:hypothetical protein OSTOST_15413, partial [Ostertagia ostertagi]